MKLFKHSFPAVPVVLLVFLLFCPNTLLAASGLASFFAYSWEPSGMTNMGVWFWAGGTISLLLILLVTIRLNSSLQRSLSCKTQKVSSLKERELLHRSLFDLSPYGCALYDMDGRFVMVNEEFCRRHNKREAEFIGQTSNNLGHYSEYDAFLDMRKRLQKVDQVQNLEFIIDSDLGPTHGLYSGKLITLGENTYILASSVDATSKKRAEAALKFSENNLKQLFDSAPLPMAFAHSLGGSYLVTIWNQSWCECFGYQKEEADGKNGLEIGLWVDENDRHRFITNLESVNGPKSLEVLLRCKDGSIRNCIIYGRFVGSPEQQILSVVYLDITERKKTEREKEQLQKQLNQTQKLESVGQLAGGVAHDYNNMLGVILGHVELAILKAGSDSKLTKHHTEIKKAAKRSAELTQQLLAFARKQTISPVVLNLNNAIQDTVEMLGWLIGEHIDLSWQPANANLSVKIDPNQLDQLLVNLCVNGRDAISGTGEVIIETKVVDSPDKSDEILLDSVEYVMLSVTDNGTGMDKETRAKIFEPFFTTKGLGHGTGLGLATVYGVVKQNGGMITVDSTPGKGSSFKVYLPRAVDDNSESGNTTKKKVVLDQPTGQTVLVVEDELGVLEVNAAMLEDLGYKVLTASKPSEAFEITDKYQGKIDLLLTDVILPEMNGKEVEERIRLSNPNIGCLFVSGYSVDVISIHGVLAPGLHFLQKPFSRQQLADKLKEALSG